MNHKQQLAHFSNDLDTLVNRYRSEYDLTYGAIVGALEFKKWILCQEAQNSQEEE